MAGSTQQGKKAAATNKAKHGRDFYRRIGMMGKKTGTGGFAYLKLHDPERLAAMGRKGGSISKPKRNAS